MIGAEAGRGYHLEAAETVLETGQGYQLDPSGTETSGDEKTDIAFVH